VWYIVGMALNKKEYNQREGVWNPYTPIQVTPASGKDFSMSAKVMAVKCLSCEKEISVGDRRVAIICLQPTVKFLNQDVQQHSTRITYCVECAKNNFSDPALAGLGLIGENSMAARPIAAEWIIPDRSMPFEIALTWYCPDCHNRLSGLERDNLFDMGEFYCHNCVKTQKDVVYKK